MEFQQEMKKLNEDLKRAHDEYKKINDDRLAKLEKGVTSVLDHEEKLKKIDGVMVKLEDRIEAMNTTLERASMGGFDPESAKKEQALLSKKAANTLFRKDIEGLNEKERAAYLEEMKAYLGEGNEEFKTLASYSNPDGGYFVRPEMSMEIEREIVESSPIRQLARVRQIGGPAWEQLYHARGTSSNRPGVSETSEGGARSNTTTAKVQKLRLSVHEMYAYPEITQTLLDDSAIDVESWHQAEVAEEFALQEADWFINGDGVSQAKGILSYTAGTGFDQIEQRTSSASADVTGDDLVDLQNDLLEPYQNNATWLMKRSVWGALRKKKDGNGQYLLSPSGGLLNGIPRELLGRPVMLADDMPVAASNSLSIAYGDFRRGYTVVDRVGIRVLRDPFTNKPFVSFHTTRRVGGGVVNFQAIKLMKFAA